MIGIYKIVSPSGKIYIGQSWNIKSRLSSYKARGAKNQQKLHRSINKYGFNNHKIELVIEFKKDTTQDILNYFERFFINYYRINGCDLLNIKSGGSNGKHSMASRVKMSISHKGKISGDKNPMYGVRLVGELNPRYGAKMPQGLKKKLYDGIQNKINRDGKHWAKGAVVPDHVRKKISESLIGRKGVSLYGSDNPFFGRKHSDDTKAKISNRPYAKGGDHVLSVKINQFDLFGNYIKTWDSLSEAIKHCNLKRTTSITNCLKNKTKTAGGFKWEYYEANN